ncbi:SGNH/GDSL hydrolase family protein [soil metagenome]
MTRTIVCYGDSNTHGADPASESRFPPEVRWPGVMRKGLGAGYAVIEEALGGRTTVWDSPLAPGRNGRDYLLPCLWSHAPLDLVIIMLGTNDLKTVHGVSANEIASGAGVLVDLARQSLAGPDRTPPAVLLVAPMPLGPTTDRSELWGFGAAREESGRLGSLYRLVARMKGAHFLDAGEVVETSPLDGVHLDEQAHARLGAALADAVREALGPG